MQALLTSTSITVPLTRAPHRRMPALPGSVPPGPRACGNSLVRPSISTPFRFCSVPSCPIPTTSEPLPLGPSERPPKVVPAPMAPPRELPSPVRPLPVRGSRWSIAATNRSSPGMSCSGSA